MNYSIYNAYPIYDWKTQDIWIANGKFGWTYNHLYDLYYQAGVPLSRQRVASPFISQAISTLFIYKVVDPDMWGRMVGRVNGVEEDDLYEIVDGYHRYLVMKQSQRIYDREKGMLPNGD